MVFNFPTHITIRFPQFIDVTDRIARFVSEHPSRANTAVAQVSELIPHWRRRLQRQ
jgi:hypothetical protein